jgi:putative transposase
MSRKGNPYDNAVVERFWRTLKYEQVYRNEYATVEQARRDIGPFMDRIYNRERLHSALDYLTPVEFEAAARAGAKL